MEPINHAALGNIVPLQTLVRDLRARAADADWSGDTDTARRLDREAEDAISDGVCPVLMF